MKGSKLRLKAIHKTTGKLLMSTSADIPEVCFKKTVSSSFPNICPSEIEIIGKTKSVLGIQINKSDSINTVKEVVWRGSFTDLGGYANMNREICFRLMFHGIKVKLDILNTAPQVDSSTRNMLKILESTKIERESESPLIIGFTPMTVASRGKRRVIFYTMMETQELHNEFVKRCNDGATEIWVPCKFYADVFRNSGITKKISVIPLGVNQHTYTPCYKEACFKYEELPDRKVVHSLPKTFRFMSLFGWSYRKGTDVLCKSFIKEFTTRDDVCLVIYSRYMGSSAEQHKEYIRNEIMGYYQEISKSNPPPIYYCGEEIPIAQLPICYNSSSCFVFCSRGEGFGLPVIEAGACEIPVISVYHTAMTEYLDPNVSYLVYPKSFGPANDKLTWISEYYREQKFAILGNEEIDEFSKLMRHVYNNNSEAKEKAIKFRKKIIDNYTWDECVKKVVDNL